MHTHPISVPTIQDGVPKTYTSFEVVRVTLQVSQVVPAEARSDTMVGDDRVIWEEWLDHTTRSRRARAWRSETSFRAF
jgi:hypothetical protein